MVYAAINDFVASTGISLGVVKNHSFACWYQGITGTANTVSSVLWTTVISYQLWLIVALRQPILDMRRFHLICWIIPWVVCLLVLTTNNFGRIDDSYLCYIEKNEGRLKYTGWVWSFCAFYFFVILSFCLMTYYQILLLKTYWSYHLKYKVILSAIQKQSCYPAIIFICWLPDLVTALLELLTDTLDDNQLLFFVTDILASCQGIFLAIVFFYQNRIVRLQWTNLLLHLFGRPPRAEAELLLFDVKNEVDYTESSSVFLIFSTATGRESNCTADSRRTNSILSAASLFSADHSDVSAL